MAVQKVFLLNQNTPTVITGGFVPKGAYAAGTDYAVGDSVSYNGSSYVMYVDAAAGTLPTDTTKWQVVANIGATGATGPVDTANSPNANEFARFTDATHIEGRTAAEVKSDLDLEIGTDLQAWSSNLDEYSAVNPTAAGLALLDDATAAAQLVTLGITASAAELSYTDGVTSAIQNQIDSKQATLVSGTNIKTINSQSLLGSGDLAFTATAGGSDTQVQFNDAGALNGDAGLVFNKTINQLSVGVINPTFGGDDTTLLEVTNTINNFSQIYHQNLSAGDSAFTDFVAGADNDDAGIAGHFVDMGITSSGFVGTSAATGIVKTVSVTAGGTGYTVGDVLTLATGDTNATVTVLTAPGGVVGTVRVTDNGTSYTTGTKSTTGGTGSGCTINVITLYDYTLFAANDGYLYVSGGGLNIGTDDTVAGKVIKFFTNGIATANERMRITDTGLGVNVTPSTNFHVRNTTNAASVQVAIFDGDRATPDNNDNAYLSFNLSDSVGNQDEMIRMQWKATSVTSGAENGQMIFSVRTAGTLAEELSLSGTILRPIADDGLSLGSSGLAWSDLFLASGAVINFNAGDMAITHSTDKLAITGGIVGIGNGATSSSKLLTVTDHGSPNTSAGANGILVDITGGGGIYMTGGSVYGKYEAYSSELGIGTMSNHPIGIYHNNTKKITLDSTSISPSTSDAYALGKTSLMWSDLFLADGGVINWNNGDVSLTHSSNKLALSGGEFSFDSSLSGAYRGITALRTLDNTDYFVDCTANTFTVTLPTAVGITGRQYIIKNSGTGVITVDGNGSETIDGQTTWALPAQYDSITIMSDGTNWKIIGKA